MLYNDVSISSFGADSDLWVNMKAILFIGLAGRQPVVWLIFKNARINILYCLQLKHRKPGTIFIK